MYICRKGKDKFPTFQRFCVRILILNCKDFNPKLQTMRPILPPSPTDAHSSAADVRSSSTSVRSSTMAEVCNVSLARMECKVCSLGIQRCRFFRTFVLRNRRNAASHTLLNRNEEKTTQGLWRHYLEAVFPQGIQRLCQHGPTGANRRVGSCHTGHRDTRSGRDRGHEARGDGRRGEDA